MNDCLVEIATIHQKNRSVMRAKGTFERHEDGFTARYLQDGDDTTLTMAGGVLTMKRRGGTELDARFCSGEESQLLLRFGENEGVIPIRTSECFHHLQGDKTCVTLKYALVYPDQLQHFLLEITIQVISEDQ